jgi:hypothetical protein
VSDNVPDQPDGIDPDSHDLPDVAAAAERVGAFLEWFGDGLVDWAGPNARHPVAPLYARDLQVLINAARGGAKVLMWHPIVPDPAGVGLSVHPVEIPLGEPWLLPGTDIRVGEFRLSTREVPDGEVSDG